MADSLDRRLSRIENKLGLADEERAEKLAAEFLHRLNRIENRLGQIERVIFGDEYGEKSADAVCASPYPDGPKRPSFGERI
jgi:hypothetical protein